MRRPVMYLAGLLMATGASLALAGPASAAPSHHPHHGHYYHGWYSNLCDNNDDDYGDYGPWYDVRSNSQNNGSHYNGIVLLSGNSGNGDGGLLGGGILG